MVVFPLLLFRLGRWLPIEVSSFRHWIYASRKTRNLWLQLHYCRHSNGGFRVATWNLCHLTNYVPFLLSTNWVLMLTFRTIFISKSSHHVDDKWIIWNFTCQLKSEKLRVVPISSFKSSSNQLIWPKLHWFSPIFRSSFAAGRRNHGSCRQIDQSTSCFDSAAPFELLEVAETSFSPFLHLCLDMNIRRRSHVSIDARTAIFIISEPKIIHATWGETCD